MKIMAVDYGTSRTGLAVCDRTEFLASPVGVIHDKSFGGTLKKIAAAVEEFDVKEVIVGHPLNMDGTAGEKAHLCEKLATMLRELVNVPVYLWDERQTTMQAYTYLDQSEVYGKKRKEMIDEVAATVILESYLAYRKNMKEKEAKRKAQAEEQ